MISTDITSAIIAFLVMLNPFALFLYLGPVREELDEKKYIKVLFKASLISFGIFIIFLLLGDFLFQSVFQINFESFRIFGGIVIFSLAYFYIVKGEKALIAMKEDLDDLAAEIALPFMIGAGTISLTILMSHQYSFFLGTLSLGIILLSNFMIILFLGLFREWMPRKKFKIAFDKNMQVLLRLFGFFIGAIGVNMIVTGMLNVFF